MLLGIFTDSTYRKTVFSLAGDIWPCAVLSGFTLSMQSCGEAPCSQLGQRPPVFAEKLRVRKCLTEWAPAPVRMAGHTHLFWKHLVHRNSCTKLQRHLRWFCFLLQAPGAVLWTQQWGSYPTGLTIKYSQHIFHQNLQDHTQKAWCL